MLDDLERIYKLDKKTAIEVAMYTVDKLINYEGIYTDEFWMEIMDELDNDRLAI